jgi:Cof subfamily protein (haloacid dehalogenase superfamily)
LVATDLDGTLLRPDGTVSDYTRSVLAQISRLVPIVLVTARAPRTARVFAARAGVDGLIVCANGALVYDTAQRSLVAQRLIPAADAATLVQAIRSAVPGVCFAFEFPTTYAWEPRYRDLIPADLVEADPLIGDALELCSEAVAKVIVRHERHDAAVLAEQLRATVGAAFVSTYSSGAFLEISAPGVDKASALAAICAERGIDRTDVIAFGDMRNDLPMLLWAGRAFAVANAHPDVLAAVTERTASNLEDGVAQALERLLLGAESSLRES